VQGRFKKEGSSTGEAGFSGPSGHDTSAGRAHGSEPFRATESSDDAAPERVGEVTAEPSGSREPSAAGSRLALRNWRISTRLVSLIALPVIAASALGVFRIQESRGDIEQLNSLQLLTDLTQQATQLATALQEERDSSAGPMVTDRDSKDSRITDLRERTDEARIAFADATFGIDKSDTSLNGIRNRVQGIGRQLNQLKDIRAEAYQDPAYISQTASRYNDLIESLLGLSQDMSLATSNSDMIDSTRALAAFSAAKEYTSIQRAMISGGAARTAIDEGKGFSASDWRYGKTAQESERAAIRTLQQLYGESDLLEPLDGGIANVVTANQLADRIFEDPEAMATEDRSYQDAYDFVRAKLDAMSAIEQTLLDEMEREANTLRSEAEREAILNGALIVLVLGISLVGAFVVARSMVRSLRRLQDTAQEVAHKRLPEVVKQMSEADPQDVGTSVESVGVHTRDEIGKVAQAFDDVHREAVRLAGEQALLRGNVNAMFTNLSRRSQGLIQRQLSLISELESREADPDQLASLFKLDHLATRMRRNGENLLVLAGEEPGRRWTRPVPLVDVLRAAASEVEQYERIELSGVPKTDVAGRVVNDLVHLLAELLENATSFSSPQTKVKVTGHALPDGRILVEIHDTGIGLSPEDLAEINDRLANPPTVDVSVSRRMGLFVVGRLSLRHGIRIQLRPSDSGGTTALVMLPAEVAQTAGRPKPATPAGNRAEGPSATLRRESMPRRQPEGGVTGGPSRAQMPGAPTRAALPSRANAPSRPQGLGPARPSQPTGAGRAGPPDRPSWANRSEDSGRIPVGEADSPRGHDDAPSTGEFPRPGFTGATVPQRPAIPGGPGDTTEFPSPVGRPGQDEERPSRGRHSAGPQGPGRSGPGQAGPGQGGPRQPGPGQPVPRGAGPGRSDDGRQDYPQQGGGRQDSGQYPMQEPQDASMLPPAPRVPGRAPERTPIFEEIESTWFGARNRAVAGAAESSRESAGSPHVPQRQTAPTPERTAAHGMPARQSAQGDPSPAEPAPQWRESPNDERWKRAEQLRSPAAGGVTTSGLPRRVPRANLVAGTAQEQETAAPAGPQVSRSPDDVRGRLTNLRRGIQQGRQAGATTGGQDRTGQGFSSPYPQER
jgi:signal transduction histidine kinase